MKMLASGSIFIRGFAGMQRSLLLKKPKRPLSVSRVIMLDGNRSSRKNWSR